MKKTVVPYTVTANKLLPGEQLTIARHAIKTQKHLSFTCELADIGEGKIYVGHGRDVSGSSWIEIDSREIKAFSYYSYADPQYRLLFHEPLIHHMKIKDFVSVAVDVNSRGREVFLIFSTSDGMIKTTVNGWDGGDGEIFACAEGCVLSNCKLNWFSDGFSRKIWILGDSYAGISNPARWPYYLYRDGYDNLMITGYPGMSAEKAAEEFRRFVDRGTPEFAVWTLGMNNADKDGRIHAGYLRSTEEFISICSERGITPILSTIPNVPDRDNTPKNNWVRSLPYRYIDFERAVGSDKHVGWYDGMLFTDGVHPTAKGAEALYMRVLCDFPEIMQNSTT